MFWLCSFGAQALTAQTSRVIEGSGPYLTSDGGLTKVTDLESLFTITLPNGRKVTPSTNTSSRINPIMFPDGSTLGDIKTIFPPSTTFLRLNDLINRYHSWGDDDGDGQGTDGVTATGTLWLSLDDKYGNTVRLNDTLDACKGPYRVTIGLNPDGASLTTQYGVPNRRVFSTTNDREYYYLSPYPRCLFAQSARPNLLLGGTTGIDRSDKPQYAGPSNIWSPTKGFLTKSTSSSSYDRNFPTTGADGLYFDLEMPVGVDGSELSWTVNTTGSISATVSWTRPRSDTFTDPVGRTIQADQWITDKSSYVTRVTLRGPRADSTQINSNNPSPLSIPSLPQTFELVGRDSGDNVEVKYGFVLKQWFVNRGGKASSWPNQTSWCRSLGYHLPRVKDLTNAVRIDSDHPISGATPNSSGNYYMRHIGAGFFTEWGFMTFYADAGFTDQNYRYWTNDAVGNSAFGVFPRGYSIHGSVGNPRYAVCTTP
ncbi:hypothetical protein [Gilliamella bombicola]|nr:hypothetical protein [Gilliamella bombicola]